MKHNLVTYAKKDSGWQEAFPLPPLKLLHPSIHQLQICENEASGNKCLKLVVVSKCHAFCKDFIVSMHYDNNIVDNAPIDTR